MSIRYIITRTDTKHFIGEGKGVLTNVLGPIASRVDPYYNF